MILTYFNAASQAGEKAGGDYLKVRYTYLEWVEQKSLEPGSDLGKLEIVGWEHGKEEEEKKNKAECSLVTLKPVSTR